MTRLGSGRILAAITVLATSQFVAAEGTGWKECHDAGLKALNDGDPDTAAEWMKKAVAGAGKIGGETTETAEALAGLSDVYLAQDRFTEAGMLLERSLFILAKTPGANAADLNHVYHNLSRVRISQERYAEAESLLKSVLAYREKTPEADLTDVADTLESLAAGYQLQGKGYASAPLEKRALELRVKSAASSPPKLVKALLELADFATFSIAGSKSEAETVRKRALAVQEKSLGADHPDVANTLMKLATARLELSPEGRFAVSESVIDTHTATEPGGVEKLKAAIVALFRQNEPLVKRALAIREKTLGAVHPDTMKAVEYLAAGYSVMGDKASAEPYLKRITSAREKTPGR